MYKNKMIMWFCGVIYLMVYIFNWCEHMKWVFFSLKFFVYNAFVAFLQLVNKNISITLFWKKNQWNEGPLVLDQGEMPSNLSHQCTIYRKKYLVTYLYSGLIMHDKGINLHTGICPLGFGICHLSFEKKTKWYWRISFLGKQSNIMFVNANP